MREEEWVEVAGAPAPGPGEVVEGVVELGDGPERLALWRTSSGTLCAFSDRCPHQWSSLAAEGLVDGEELVCGAHGWRFDVDGEGWKLAMSGRRDPKAPVATFAVRAAGERVWVRRRRVT